MTDATDLYQQVILDHNRAPRNFRRLEPADRVSDGANPLCGDQVTVYLAVQDGVVRDVSFQGQGCAISKASASIMTTEVKGKTVEEAERLFRDFQAVVTGKVAPDPERLGRLAAFAGVAEYPARVKCASLAWHTLHAALEQKDGKVSTE